MGEKLLYRTHLIRGLVLARDVRAVLRRFGAFLPGDWRDVFVHYERFGIERVVVRVVVFHGLGFHRRLGSELF
jgi:hypothetical protein